MRIAFLMIIGLLAGCNSSDDDSALQQQISNIPKGITQAQLNAAISAATHAEEIKIESLNASLDKLQLIGHPISNKIDSVRTLAELGEPTVGAPNAATIPTPGQFGPCTDMGVLLGRGVNANSNDPLSAPLESFQTCQGYEYSVLVGTAQIAMAPRIFWDGPNCTGNMFEWEAGGGGYNTQTLHGGVVFSNPVDGTTILMVSKGQTPKPVMMQSVWVISNPGCQSDVETQLLYQVTNNDTNITGVSNSVPSGFQLTAP